tara:strand:+ start:14 stop:943 length:930 start_codon:yes stop_codon:yes gene_type:complete
MAPIKSSLARTAAKLLGISNQRDLSLRGAVQSKRTPDEFAATGGTVVTPGNGYRYHVFTSDGDFVVTGSAKNCEVLLVGGGGGGGSGGGGQTSGGGAGGVRFYPSLPISSGTYPVVIGQGGNHAPAYDSPGTKGGNSTAFGKTATGGGHVNYNYTTVANGGSGGGVSYNASAGTGNAGGNDPDANPVSEGNNGGPGGGGGAGEAAVDATRGGNGLQFPNFTGPLIGQPSLNPYNGYYGGGGGAGYESADSTPGGLGGGGHGASRYGPNGTTATQGVDMLGGGGGGTSTESTTAAKPGGNGICVVRYQPG